MNRTVLSKPQYLDRWRQLHGRYDQDSSSFVRPWLSLMYRVSAPIARSRVSPNWVTVIGVFCALCAAIAAYQGGTWLLVAAASIIVSAVLDGVDGAVAVIARRDDAWGFVVDSVADRCSDLLFLTVVGFAGAPWSLVVPMMALTLLHEGARARAGAAGLREVGVITVWERPSRVVTAVLVAVTAAVLPASATTTSTWGAVVGLVLAVLGSLQLAVVLRRALLGRRVEPPPDVIDSQGQGPSHQQ